jgi:eukaryotic-like serine/threonine-protein kinase
MAQLGVIWADGIWNTSIWNTAIWAQAAVQATVPDVVGETEANAIAAVEAEGLVANVKRAYSSSVLEGLVISQNPTAGSEVDEGSSVRITISRGPYVPGTSGFIEFIQ